MAAVKLTKRTVEAAKPGAKDIILWDNELKGFGCKITPKGKRVYFAYYRTRNGIQRRPTIGPHGPVTCEQARAFRCSHVRTIRILSVSPSRSVSVSTCR